MKKLRKVLALVLAMVMVLGMNVSVFAQTYTYDGVGKTENGSITVNNASQGQTYSLYKLFDATVANGTIAYTVSSVDSLKNNAYFEIVPGTVNNVQVKSGVDIDALNRAAADETSPNHDAGVKFIEWVETFGIQIGKTLTADATGSVTWDKIPYGYYYVKSSLGALLTINSTRPDNTVQDKNTKNPAEDTTKKIVGTGDNGNEFTSNTTTAKIGDDVNYKITFTATNYNAANVAQNNYSVVDTSTGLDIDSTSIGVTVTPQTAGATAQTLMLNTDYTVVKDNGTLTINIPWQITTGEGANATTIFKYNSPATVTITYTGKLTSTTGINSVVVNKNGHSDTTYVYTAEYDLTKVAADSKTEDDAGNVTYSQTLSGAEFDLYDASTNGNKIAVVQDTDADGEAIPGSYTVDPNGTSTAKLVVDSNGKVTIKGLKQGTAYYLEETKAPDGYTLPSARIALSASNGEKKANETVVENIENTKGVTLPSTGGMGTTLFYVFGAVLVIGAGIVLVTRRRMAK